MNTYHADQNPSSPPAPTTRRRSGRLRLAAATAMTALVVVAAACGDESSDSATIDAIEVTSPSEGATVDGSFEVEVDTGESIGEPDTGRQHLHFYYDVEPGAEDYDIVYDLPFTTRELSPGEHTIHVAVANGDHSLTDVRDELTVTVEPGGGESSDGDDSGDDEPAPAPAPEPSDDSDDSDSPIGY